MADFFQNGTITTLSRLNRKNDEQLEKKLEYFNKINPITLVLPSLYSELERPALKHIVEELKKVRYLNRIVIGMDHMDKQQFEHAKKFFSALPQDHAIIWNDGPRMQKLYRLLEKNDLNVGEKGKGRTVWMGFGYVLSDPENDVIALHDCDIVSYNKSLLTRLCYPIANPNMTYEFCKGFYARTSDKINGRCMRLFITPLIRALERLIGHTPLLRYLDSFRYPLAGEFSLTRDLAMSNRIPYDWGLEIGTLVEIYRNSSLSRICQVDLCDAYEHKHQVMNRRNTSSGLMKMAIDIAKTFFRQISSDGVILSEGLFKALRLSYIRIAEDQIDHFDDIAAINSLKFDRHSELVAVQGFANAIRIAAKQYWGDPLKIPLIPQWSRVVSAIPDFFDQLLEEVDKDNR